MKSSEKYFVICVFVAFFAYNHGASIEADDVITDTPNVSDTTSTPSAPIAQETTASSSSKEPETTIHSNTTLSTTPAPIAPTVAPDSTSTAAPNTTSTVAPDTTTVAPNTTTTTLAPNTTTTTLAPNTTTPATTTTLAPNTTTTSTTTVAPNNTTTTVAPPTTTTESPIPPPCHRFDGPSFIGGIVLTLGLLAIGLVAYKFYKARNERNYHTL